MKRFSRVLNFVQREWLSLLLILLGTLLRVKHFCENRSLWLDESYVAINIANRSFEDIFSSAYIFPGQPKSPLGFYLMGKLSVLFFGNHEMALRLFPLMTSILALILFYYLARKYCSRITACIALAFFSVSPLLIYYAAEVKHYSGDVLMALILYFVFFRYMQKDFTLTKARLWGVFGGIILWFSNACIFILAGMGCVVFIQAYLKRDFAKIKRLTVTFLIWAVSFIFLYRLTLKGMVQSGYIVGCFQDGFPPVPYFSMDFLHWGKRTTWRIFNDLLGVKFPVFSIGLFCLGCFSLLRRDKEKFFVLVLPILATGMATCLYRYPFMERLYLFLVGGFLIVLSEGLQCFLRAKKKYFQWAGSVLLILLLVAPIQTDMHAFLHGQREDGNRAAMKFLKEHYQPGDRMMLNNSAQFPFIYYLNSLGIADQVTHASGTEKVLDVLCFYDEVGMYGGTKYFGVKSGQYLFHANGYFYQTSFRENSLDVELLFPGMPRQILRELGGERIWVFFSHKHDDKDFVLSVLDEQGERALSFETDRACIYLYAFNRDQNNE